MIFDTRKYTINFSLVFIIDSVQSTWRFNYVINVFLKYGNVIHI